MMGFRTAVVALALLAVGAMNANAQVRQGRFQVTTHGGWQSYADGSAVQGGASLGADATYYVTPSVGVGFWTDLTFTETDGSKFVPAALSFVDSTTFTVVNQPLDIWQYGAHVKVQLQRSLSPFLLVGAGAYTLFFDPQQTNGNNNVTGFAARFAVGVDFAVSDVTGFQIGVSDAYYPSWKPERLFPVREEFRNTRFPELNPDPGDLDDSVHNFKVFAGVTLLPGGL